MEKEVQRCKLGQICILSFTIYMHVDKYTLENTEGAILS